MKEEEARKMIFNAAAGIISGIMSKQNGSYGSPDQDKGAIIDHAMSMSLELFKQMNFKVLGGSIES